MKIDKKLIKELVDNLKEFNLTELEYQDGDKKIKVSRASRVSTEQIKAGAVISGNKSVLANKSDEDGIRIKSPIIELHITNIYNREEFRHKSLVSKVAKGIVCGFGTNGYIMALNSLNKILNK